MQRLFWFIVFTFVVFGTATFLPTLISAQGIPQPTSGSGINIDPTSSGGYPSPDDIKTLGAQWVRFVYEPNHFSDKATYEQRFADAVNTYSRAGIDVIVVLNQDSTPNLSYTDNVADLTQNNYINSFADTAKFLATTYRGKISGYEVWNEENAKSEASIQIDPSQYATLLASTYNSIKSNDPNSKVVIGGIIGGEPGYLQNILNNFTDKSNLPFDGIGVHPYDPVPANSAAMLLSYFDLARQTGKPLWVTEVGWQGDQNPESQAAYIRDIYAFAKDHPEVIANMMWYAWSDSINPGFGVIGEDGKAKISFQAFQQFAAKLKTLINLTYQFKPIEVPPLKPVIKSIPPQKTSPFKSFAEESEEPCPNVEGGFSAGDVPGDIPTYHKAGGGSEPAFNGSLGMNFSTSVKGTHCGQTKSQPLVLEEVAPFDLSKDPQCKTVRWAGEIQLNYNSPDNFRLPFAKELADHWAGKGPEHDVTAGGGFLQTIQQIAQKVVPGLAAPPPVPAGGKYPLIGVSNVDKNAENSPENNMWLRPAPVLVNQPKALIQCGYPADQPPDPQAPQLSSIVGTDPGAPDAFTNTYRVRDPGGGLAGNWDVGLLGLKATAGQVVKTPGGGHDIDGAGDKYMVTYAEEHKITLINAAQDTVVIDGQLPYVVHIDGIDVDPALVQAYREASSAGRNYLPALSGSEAIGVASGDEVRVAVRDSGDWTDPRSKGDWWQNFPDAPVGGLCKGGAGGGPKKTAQDRKLLTDAGVLKKLLPGDSQDALKCSFINYVKKKGPTSGYANFSFDGTRLTDIPCPPSVSGNYDRDANDNWRNSWGKTWVKMGLFPDEKSTGQLRFAVCADKLYDMENAYPNVFRLGQAANELFRVFTAKDNQDSYYRLNKDESNLKRPLDQNRSLVKSQNAITRALAGLFQNLIDKVKQTIGKWFAFAQEPECGGSNQYKCEPFSYVNSQGKVEYGVKVTLPTFAEGDISADLYINGEKQSGTPGYKFVQLGGEVVFGSNGSGGRTAPEWNPLSPGKYQVYFHIVGNTHCEGGCERYGFVASVPKAGGCQLDSTSGSLVTSCPGPPPPLVTAQVCPANTCCETITCTASCGICGRAEKDPSDTTMWPADWPRNHSLVGVAWDNPAGPGGLRFGDDTKVKLTFKIPGWENGNPLPEGCKFVQCSPTNLSCLTNTAYGCNDAGTCGFIKCEKVHTRVVDVYNKVPFLASVWNQAAGVGSGFFNIFRSASLVGSGLTNNIVGCTTNTNLVLNPSGNFGTNPAYSELTYSFDQGFGVGAERSSFDFGQNEVTVSQVSPAQGGKAKITFYRLGGVCNADYWVSQKLLAP